MKRGFLKKSISVSPKRTDTSPSDSQPEPQTTGGERCDKPKWMRMPYGKLDNPGKPEGYQESEMVIKEIDAKLTEHEEGVVLFTSFPLKNLGETRVDLPDGWCEAIVDSQTKRKILSQKDFPRPLRQPEVVSHRIGPSSVAGLGMFCTRDLAMGDIVLSERPLAMFPANTIGTLAGGAHIPEHFTLEQHQQAMLHEAEKGAHHLLARMDPGDQAAYLSLYNSHTEDGSGPIIGVLRTNGIGMGDQLAFQKDLLSDEEIPREIRNKLEAYSGVGKEVSRMNHCSPNVTVHFDLPSFSFQVFAVRDIKKDEEIFFSYAGTCQPKTSRWNSLAPYGIYKCDCKACKDPQSDARRAKIKGVNLKAIGLVDLQTNPQLVNNPVWAERTRMVLEQIHLIEGEGVETHDAYPLYLLIITTILRHKLGERYFTDRLAQSFYKKLEGSNKHVFHNETGDAIVRMLANQGLRKKDDLLIAQGMDPAMVAMMMELEKLPNFLGVQFGNTPVGNPFERMSGPFDFGD